MSFSSLTHGYQHFVITVCMAHTITEATGTAPHFQNMNRMTCLQHVTEKSHSPPLEMKKAPLWGYTTMIITAPIIDTYTYIPVTLPPLAHYSNYVPCVSSAHLYNITFTSNSLSSHYPHVKRSKNLWNQYKSSRGHNPNRLEPSFWKNHLSPCLG